MTFTMIALITMWLMASFTIHAFVLVFVDKDEAELRDTVTKWAKGNTVQGALWCVSLAILGLPALVFLFVCNLAKSIMKSL